MQRTPVFVPGLVLLLVACLLIAGCSSPDTTNQTLQTDTPTITTNTGAQLAAGDIVKNPASSATTAWLVIGYDPATDTYERALVYKNADGSWGHRSDNRTENTSRSVMDKVYTEKLATTDPSSVRIVTPTIVMVTETTPAGGKTPVTTIPTTDVSTLKPSVERSLPDYGYTGTTVAITDLVGKNFVTGATVYLARNNSNNIPATNVKVVSQKLITCSFVIPADAAVGPWDLTVRNPNGMYGTWAGYFEIHKDISAVTTSGATHSGTVPIDNIDPPIGHIGNYDMVITGSHFQAGASVKLEKTGKTTLTARTTNWISNTTIRSYFTIPPLTIGTYDLVVTNPDQTFGRWTDGVSFT